MDLKVLLTDEFIEELLTCPKTLTNGNDFKVDEGAGHRRLKYEITSTDGKNFEMFGRQNVLLPERFSFGLMYVPVEASSVCLVRYNGDHGWHTNRLTGEEITGCHIHKISEEIIASKFNDDNHAEFTDRYISVDEALRVFCEDLNIVNANEHFPRAFQLQLI